MPGRQPNEGLECERANKSTGERNYGCSSQCPSRDTPPKVEPTSLSILTSTVDNALKTPSARYAWKSPIRASIAYLDPCSRADLNQVSSCSPAPLFKSPRLITSSSTSSFDSLPLEALIPGFRSPLSSPNK